MTASGERSAFYAVGRGTGGLGDWVTLLHPPYTLWHLSYVAIGAAVMPDLVLWRLAGTLLAFFLAVGIGAHALDELHGRPLGTGISSGLLTATAVASITAAMVLGLVYGGWKLLPFVIAGGILVYAYNLELFGGVLHSDVWFAVAWGAFPVLVGAYAQHLTLSLAAGVAAAAAFFLSLGQRALSTPARMLRRRVNEVAVRLSFPDGSEAELGRADLLAPLFRLRHQRGRGGDGAGGPVSGSPRAPGRTPRRSALSWRRDSASPGTPPEPPMGLPPRLLARLRHDQAPLACAPPARRPAREAGN